MFDFSEAMEIALRTWYPKGHSLHLNPHHPLGKLEGEWGELKEDQMKIRYKPNYIPETEKELGDIWYYLRILNYQKNHQLRMIDMGNFFQDKSTEYLISCATNSAALAFMSLEDYGFYSSMTLDMSYSILLELAGNRLLPGLKENTFQSALEQLTYSNWEKLKPGSVRGDQWTKAHA